MGERSHLGFVQHFPKAAQAMSNPLLITKLHVPQARTGIVPRPQLVMRLKQGLAKKLILVSAPAGYGKTTLVCEWLASCRESIAWVSLDRADDDPLRFWDYVLAALQGGLVSVGRSFPDSLLDPDHASGEELLTALINALDKLAQPLILVLDDYHNIETPSIHEGLSFLLEHAPSDFHLVITTRADPPLPLSRLRVRSQLIEVRLADLRFTAGEATDFLNRTMGLAIVPENVDRLTARTEGWIAGLQMAALSLQGAEDVDGLITAFSGSDHYVFDYFVDEILKNQTPAIRRFLLHTSILDQLTGSLCDAVLGQDRASADTQPAEVVLDGLERSNLFILPLDPEHRWYRYHPLFAELLRGYLQQKYPDLIPILHTRASAWCEGQGLIAEAIHHALAGGEWERVVRLISANVFALLEQNELNQVAKRLDNIAGEESLARPWLGIGRAWLAAYTGELSTDDSTLSLIEAQIDSMEGGAGQQTLRGHCAAIRAFSAWVGGKRAIAIGAAREALDTLPETELTIRCQSATVLGLSMDDMDARAEAFGQALDYARRTNVSHVVLFAHGCHAYLLVLQGKLRRQRPRAEAMQLAEASNKHQPLPSLSYVYSTLSMVQWEWNDLEAALDNARHAVALARRWGQADALHFAYTNLGNALFAAGDVDGAFDILQRAWQIAQRTSAWFEEITISQEVGWHLEQGNLEAALHRLRLAQIEIDGIPGPFLSSLVPICSAQIFLARKEYPRALSAIASILDDLERRKVVYFQVGALALQSTAFRELGHEAEASASLKKALALAAPEGYMRSFLMARDGVIPMLHQARAAGIEVTYVDKLLGFLEQGDKAKPVQAGRGPGLIEPLSAREMDVLNLLAQGQADKQIAGSLFISRETVHKHLKNIYGKLGVHRRTEAIVRARELGLL
jgi:LuxR family maltose regulon positive regulatory protein